MSKHTTLETFYAEDSMFENERFLEENPEVQILEQFIKENF